jgi:hypothetical protein
MDQKELDDLEYFAAQLYSDSRLAAILGVKADELTVEILAARSHRAKAIIKGRTARETAIRESILDSAVNGSSPAQHMAMDMLKQIYA